MSMATDTTLRVHTVGRSREKTTGDQRTMVPIYDFAHKSSPCRESCPAGHDISWSLHLLESGKFSEAHRLFREDSPFPSITGRVCYHPCETSCSRKDHDQPISINALERAMAEYGAVEVSRCAVTYPEQAVAVIGSGPAGCAVAYHLVQLGYPVTVFEREDRLGGVLRYGIPAYRLPKDVVDLEFERMRSLGIEFRTGAAVGESISFKDLERDYRAIFLGIGKRVSATLPVDGIGSIPSQGGLEFLRDVNSGATTRLDGEVLVIGGGDVAIDVVRTSMRIGARAVHLYCLESRETMPAHPEEVEAALAEGLYFNPRWAVQKIALTPEGRIRVEFRGVVRLEEDFRPVLNDRTSEAVVDHLVYAVGQRAEATGFPEALWENGVVKADHAGRTPLPHVFAAGDVAGSYNVVQAIGSGKRAAIAIDCHLQNRDADAHLRLAAIGGKGTVSMRLYRDALDGRNGANGLLDIVKIDRINLDYFPERDRITRPEIDVRERVGFIEVNGTISRDEAIREALRCFNCSECTVCGNCFVYCPDSAVVQREDGFFAVVGEHCKGCGQCVHECPRCAMTMVIERER